MSRAKRQVNHWDRKKKRYVKIAMSEIDNMGVRKKSRNESGAALSKRDKAFSALKKQYREWTDKTQRSIGRVGAPENNRSKSETMAVSQDWRRGRRSANRLLSDGLEAQFSRKNGTRKKSDLKNEAQQKKRQQH